MGKGSVYLVGMMGAGKTTVGKKLARATGWPFVDLDRFIEQTTGVTVTTIFEIEGESGFRQRESLALTQVAEEASTQVVATGGGVVLDPRNRACLAASGLVVYLHAAPELLYQRTRNDKGRPLLQVDDPLAHIRRLVERRDPLYREVAGLTVESGIGLGKIVDLIGKTLKLR